MSTSADGVIYVLTPRVEALVPVTGKMRPASGGDLMWYRHSGRDDGSFTWEGPKKVGTGWGELSRVFAGGDGVVYAVTPVVESVVPLTGKARPATGGDLMWYRHVGRDDGTFKWEGPKKVGIGWGSLKHIFPGNDGVIYGITADGDLMWYRHLGRDNGGFAWEGPKKVGVGWGEFTHVFAGDDGVIYGVTPRVEARVPVTGKVRPASGGDLMWFRHVGRDDGSFTWEGPKKVGTGWGEFVNVFAGGDGIVYALTPVVESLVPVTGKARPATGGDLMWYRHLGRDNGSFRWQGPKKVGVGWGTVARVFYGGGDLSPDEATRAIMHFHADTNAVLSVGSPTGPVRRIPNGGFEQACTFGSIIKPRGDAPILGQRYHVSISIAGVKCFATDDPNTDEPYLITTVYKLDPSEADEAVDTRRIGPEDIGDVGTGDVFAKSRQLARNVTVPGDGSIRVNVQLWDVELLGDYEKLKKNTSAAAQAVIAAGMTALGGGAPGAAAAALAEAAGWLGSVGDAIGEVVSDMLGDDLIDQVEFVIPSTVLQEICFGDPSTLERTSWEVAGMNYNFPDGPEDDTWLFSRGSGVYRVFLRLTRV